MHPDLAKAALVFLARVDLKGSEAPALMELVKVLTALAEPYPLPQPQEVVQAEAQAI